MKEIHDFLLENMPVPAQRECLHEVYEATNACEYVKENMSRAWNPFSAAYLYMQRIYQIPIGSNLVTEDIVKLDAVRDQTCNAVDGIVEAQLKSPDPEMVAAARQLAQTKVSFPVDTRKGYLYQTAQLDTYLGVMLGAQLENTTKVGLLPIIQNLKAVNDQIHALIQERGDENVDKGQDLTRPEARQKAVDTWRTMVKYVNGYNLVILGEAGANPQVDRYIDTCNDIGKRYRGLYLNGTGNKPANGEGSEGNEEENGGEGNGSNNGESTEGGNTGTGNENTGGTPPEQENPNQPPPPTGGGESGFD